MIDENPRSRAAREAAERALVRVVYHYGQRPEFIVIGGLVPELLCAAARSRRKPKDWYDIAFVLAHNDVGGPVQAAALVSECFGNELNVMRSSLDDLVANFAEPNAQGSIAYQMQMMIDHPDLDATTLRADAVVNVNAFINALRMPRSEQLS